jgi:hypothetical protein
LTGKKKTSSSNSGSIYIKRKGFSKKIGKHNVDNDEEESFFLTNHSRSLPDSGLDPDVTITPDFLPQATSSLIEESSFMTTSPKTTKSNKKENKYQENQNHKSAKKSCNGNNSAVVSNGHASSSPAEEKSSKKALSPHRSSFKTSLQYDSSGIEVDESAVLTDANSFEVPSYSPASTTTIKRSSKRTRSRTCFLCSWIFMLLFLFTLQISIAFIGFISSEELDTKSRDEKQTLSFIQHLLHDLEYHDESDDAIVVPVDQVTSSNSSKHDENHLMKHDREFLSHLLLSTPRRRDFDSIEGALKCCGLKDYEDYPREVPVPDSCCRSPHKRIISSDSETSVTSPFSQCGLRKHPSNIYYDGCSVRIMETMRDELNLLSALSLGFSAVEIFGLIFSCTLYIHVLKRLNQNKRRGIVEEPVAV